MAGCYQDDLESHGDLCAKELHLSRVQWKHKLGFQVIQTSWCRESQAWPSNEFLSLLSNRLNPK